MTSETVCITTWLIGSHLKGTLVEQYCIASIGRPYGLLLSHSYTTPEGARRAARRQGFTVMPGVAQGHEAARRWLGLPPSPEFQDRARRFTAQPITRTERFTGSYADSFAA